MVGTLAMTWTMLGLAIGAALAVAVPVARLASRYRRMFSDAHFQEVHDRFVRAIHTVEAAWRESAGDPAAKDAFVTSAQLAIVVTTSLTNGRRVLHVSLSQTSGMTTAAVASRFGFFLVTALNRNKMQLDPFVTSSGVRHLVFAWDGTPLAINDLGHVMEHYRTGYQPLPFRSASIEHG
jgi:hypothetical protein